MIPQIKRILHPTDMSETAGKAFLYAASIAFRVGGLITVLHVLDEGSPNTKLVLDAMLGTDGWEESRRNREAEVIREIRDKIEAFCMEATKGHPECSYLVDQIIVEVGHPVERILHHIEQGDADMVVMGSRGHGVLKETLLGSTSHRVLRRSPVPVLIVSQ